jgi:hypothetical protein
MVACGSVKSIYYYTAVLVCVYIYHETLLLGLFAIINIFVDCNSRLRDSWRHHQLWRQRDGQERFNGQFQLRIRFQREQSCIDTERSIANLKFFIERISLRTTFYNWDVVGNLRIESERERSVYSSSELRTLREVIDHRIYRSRTYYVVSSIVVTESSSVCSDWSRQLILVIISWILERFRRRGRFPLPAYDIIERWSTIRRGDCRTFIIRVCKTVDWRQISFIFFLVQFNTAI